MIWDVLSPLYDFFETIYNGKCFKGIAEEIKNHVGKDDVMLECACGTGLLTLPMAQICKEIVATDYSDGMLKQTQKKSPAIPMSRFKKPAFWISRSRTTNSTLSWQLT